MAPQGMPSFPDPGDLLFNRYTLMAIGILTIFYTLKNYMKGAFYSSGERLDNKTAIITGGNCGIGKQIAIDYARRGAKVILACRNETLAKEAIEDIEDASNVKTVRNIPLDLNSFDSIRKFAKQFLKEEERLDILVNNAGVMMAPEERTADGWDVQLQTNFLGPMLLTELLLEKMISTKPSRIVMAGASAYNLGTIRLDDLNMDAEFTSGEAFSQSKLALMMWGTDLSQRLWDKGVTVNMYHPGVTRTNIHRHMAFRTNIMVKITFWPFCWLLMKNPVDGAATALYLSVDPDVARATGGYYVDCVVKPVDEKVLDEEIVDPLLAKAREIVGLKKLTAPDKTPPPVSEGNEEKSASEEEEEESGSESRSEEEEAPPPAEGSARRSARRSARLKQE